VDARGRVLDADTFVGSRDALLAAEQLDEPLEQLREGVYDREQPDRPECVERRGALVSP
jgi:hypothetical protein